MSKGCTALRVLRLIEANPADVIDIIETYKGKSGDLQSSITTFQDESQLHYVYRAYRTKHDKKWRS